MSKIINVDIKKFSYSKETILKDITFSVNKGEFIVITGLSGCGKTSLLRLLNGLIPSLYDGNIIGQISILDKSISDYKAGEIAKYVGNVFQNPNDQFFSKDVENEVALIGENMGMERNLLRRKVQNSLQEIGISDLKTRKVRELSGGQKRRVAIAGVLAMNPEVLILDEPTAGLDPKGRDELFDEIIELKKSRDMTVILVSHSMEDVAKYVDRLLVMNAGELVLDGTPKEVFKKYKYLESIGLSAPGITYIVERLKKEGIDLGDDITTIEEARDAILKYIKRKDKNA